MSLPAHNEDLIVLEPMNLPTHGHGQHGHAQHGHAQHGHAQHGHGQHSQHGHDHLAGNNTHIDTESVFVVTEPVDIEIVVEDIPGAGSLQDLPLIVEEEPEIVESKKEPSKEEKSQDENDARKFSKKNEKWDWESKGASGFVTWVKERLDGVPRHSGMDTAGLERAISYLERLDSEISKAMRLDLDGDLDADKIEEVRSKIDDGLSRLQDRLEKVKKTKKSYKKKKADLDIESSVFIKEAQKVTGVQGVYVTVPLLISRIARVCINGMVSGGHDIEDLYHRQVKFYKLNDREQAEVMQLLADMGYALRQDRGFMPEDALEVSDSDGMDWASSYKG